MCSGPRVDFHHHHKRTRLRARYITKRGRIRIKKSVALPLIHTTRPSKIMMAFSAPRGERDPLLTLVESSSSSSNIREEKSALESFRKKRESSLRNKEKFTEQKRKKKKFKDRRMARIKRFTMFSRTPRCSY